MEVRLYKIMEIEVTLC